MLFIDMHFVYILLLLLFFFLTSFVRLSFLLASHTTSIPKLSELNQKPF